MNICVYWIFWLILARFCARILGLHLLRYFSCYILFYLFGWPYVEPFNSHHWLLITISWRNLPCSSKKLRYSILNRDLISVGHDITHIQILRLWLARQWRVYRLRTHIELGITVWCRKRLLILNISCCLMFELLELSIPLLKNNYPILELRNLLH